MPSFNLFFVSQSSAKMFHFRNPFSRKISPSWHENIHGNMINRFYLICTFYKSPIIRNAPWTLLCKNKYVLAQTENLLMDNTALLNVYYKCFLWHFNISTSLPKRAFNLHLPAACYSNSNLI